MSPDRTLSYGDYTITENSFGYQSYNKDGKPLVFSATEKECSYWTDKYLKSSQDKGW
jgi:hypothetical protein